MKNSNTSKNTSNASKLQSHGGRFVSITVSRKKTGVTSYCAKIQSVTDKTLRFLDVNAKKMVTVPLTNVVSVS